MYECNVWMFEYENSIDFVEIVALGRDLNDQISTVYSDFSLSNFGPHVPIHPM